MKLRKVLSVVLSVIMLLSIAPLGKLVGLDLPDLFATEASAATYNGLTYRISDGKVTITDCDTSKSGELTIPSAIDGKAVIKIASNAFRGCDKLTSVTIPYGVISIGYCAFYECKALKSIKIPNSVTSIENTAFSKCDIRSVEIPASVKTIGENSFNNCANLTSVEISNGLEVIGSEAFRECIKLTSIKIPDSVKTVGDRAFYECKGLKIVELGSGLSSLGKEVFYDCTCLTSFSVSSSNKCFSTDKYGVLYNKNKTELISYTIGSLRSSFTIPSGVTSISDYAFYNCSNIKSIKIPDSVIYIGRNVFTDTAFYKNASNWKNGSLYLSNCLLEVDGWEVSGKYKVNDKTRVIAGSAFSLCYQITSITIPDSVKSIGDNAFKYCESLSSMTIPDSVKIIGNNIFEGCVGLTSVKLPSGIKEISEYMFAYCKKLKTLKIPTGVTSIGTSAFMECESLINIDIPDKVKSIGEFAFQSCTSLTSAEIPNGVTELNTDAFRGCKSLSFLKIPVSLKIVGFYAFYGCTSLKDVNYCGSKEEWALIKFDSGNECLTGAHIHYNCPDTIKLTKTSYTYTGKEIKPTVTVKDSKGKEIASANYTVKYSDNTKVGTGKAVVTVKGVAGTRTLTFTIVPKQVAGLKASGEKTSSIKLSWSKIAGAKYYKVEQSTDGKKWKTVTTTDKTSYTVKSLKAGTKYQFRVTALDSTKKIAGKASSVLKAGTLTKAPTLKLKSTKSKTATASWGKVTGASKYAVYKSTNNKKWTKVTTTTKTSYNLTKLTGGKKIYVRVTALNAYSKASAYSGTKNVTVKK